MFEDAKKQILVAHHDAHYVNSLLKLLQEREFDVLTASSGQGVIEKAEALDIDLILLGEGLESPNGFEVCRQLKGHTRTEHIPLILLTRNSQSDARIKGYHHGADDCLAQDVDKDELCVRMEAVWRRGNGEFKSLRESRQREVIQEISRIITKRLIESHFQPIYFIKPFRLFGIEVLSRPPVNSFLKNADELFNSAVKYDMYHSLELLCWQTAVDIIVGQSRNEHLFFNCSPHIIESSKFQHYTDIFNKSQLPLNKVVLEITERSAISKYDVFCEHLNKYRKEGFRFAVDDVGGGYASLESIVVTKPEIVKIDIHIVRGVHLDPVKQSIIKFIVAFCRENDIISVAEGVEVKEEMDMIAELGVSAVQGYYLFRPTHRLNIREMKDRCVAFA